MVDELDQATRAAEGRVVWAARRQAHLLAMGATVTTCVAIQQPFFMLVRMLGPQLAGSAPGAVGLF
jgi:hypothetical protein